MYLEYYLTHGRIVSIFVSHIVGLIMIDEHHTQIVTNATIFEVRGNHEEIRADIQKYLR
ncbi:hypothetical protein GCM10027442_41310 [Emticicia fontis]